MTRILRLFLCGRPVRRRADGVGVRAAAAPLFLAGAALPATPQAPEHLRCEYQEAPLAVDTRIPRFSWWVNDLSVGARQSAWQVQVFAVGDSVPDGAAVIPGDCELIWDSGKRNGDDSVNVPYGGRAALRPGGRYCWRVRTWDAAGDVSPWSRPAEFEMGFLKGSDWKAVWVGGGQESASGSGDALQGARWIWYGPTAGKAGARVRLRRVFRLPGTGPYRGRIVCTADNAFELWLNGRPVGRGDSWRRTYRFDVSGLLRSGPNLIAVRARNEDGPCGCILTLSVDVGNGRTVRVQTGEEWRAAPDSPGEEHWTHPAYDDSGWAHARVVGKWGDAPWTESSKSPFRSVLMRREFELSGVPVRARLRVCGLGVYEARINGRRVGEDRLTPGWTRFERRIQYQTYRVTSRLRAGRNAVGLMLGNGWWHGRIGGENNVAGRAFPRAVLQLDVWFADGRTVSVTTDGSWKWTTGPILSDSIYDGERYDAREEKEGWDSPGYDDSSWAAVRVLRGASLDVLRPQAKEPLRILEEIPAAKVWKSAPGEFVVDFGRNLAGWVRVRVQGPPGTVVRLRHAEVLKKDGRIDVANLRSARATDEFILAGGGRVETFEPHFTYHGFRYVEVTGWSGGTPPLDAFTACVISTACPQIGRFRCSNDLINAFQGNILRGARSNMYSVPTDCPQRDERLGWTGDAQVFANTMCWNFHAARFLSKWLRDIRDCQRPDGAVQNVAPTHQRGVASPAWGDACIIVPWQVWRHFGDVRIIRENWDCMTAWLGFLRKHARNGLYERDGYGDWIAVAPSLKKPISAAYYYYDHVLMARMARAVGRTDAALGFEREAERIRAAFNAKYFDVARGWYPGGTQTAFLLPLYFGIVPERAVKRVVANLTADICRRGEHLSTGFLGTAYLLPVLSRFGCGPLAWRLAVQDTYPSWGYMVRRGATTVWELWNSDRAGPGMNSRNHFALGSVGEWYYEHLAGIRPAEPGFRRIVIAPEFPEGLRFVSATVESPRGLITSSWNRDGAGIRLAVMIPPNTEAAVRLPAGIVTSDGVEIVGAGRIGKMLPRGIRAVRKEGGRVVLRTGAGRYTFTIHPAGAGGG